MISRLYGMWMGLQQQQEARARQNLQSFLALYPNATDDQKRAAIQQYQQQTAHLNPSFRMTFPTEAIPGPVTQAATPGVAPEAPGTAQNAPVGPSGGAPLAPGEPSVAGGVLRESPSSEGVAATPEVRGPSPGTEIAVPRSDPLQQTGADNPAWDNFLKQNVSPQAYNFLRTLPIGEALQQDPMLKMLYFGQAGGGGGATPAPQTGGQIPGQPGAPAGMTPQQGPVQGQTPDQGQSPQGPAGIYSFGHTTWGDVDPNIKDNPLFAGIANQQVPISFWNVNTGEFNYSSAMSTIDRVQSQYDREHGTPYQQQGRSDTLSRNIATDVGKLVTGAIATARAQGSSGGVDVGKIHDTLQGAIDRLNVIADKYKDNEIVQQAVQEGLAQIRSNNSQTLFDEGQKSRLTMARTQQEMVLAQKNYELNVARLGISQEQAGIAASRLGISQAEYALRVQQITNNAVLGQYDAAQSRGDTATMKRLQPQADAVMKSIGVTTPYSGKGKLPKPTTGKGSAQVATVNAQVQGLWKQIFAAFPDKKVTDAIKRVEYGNMQSGDHQLLMNTKSPSGQTAWNAASRLANLHGQLESRGGGKGSPPDQPSKPSLPSGIPKGAKMVGQDKRTGHDVYQGADGKYYDGTTGDVLPAR